MIGVGKLGQDCAEVMSNHYDVVGYDVAFREPAFTMVNTIKEAVDHADIIFIAAPTPHDPIYGGETPTSHLPNKDFDYTIVTDILNEVNKHSTLDKLVVLISTVLPGTVRNQLRPCITNARFIYNPYLIAMGTIKWDMVNPEMVIIGTEDGSITGDAKELIDFYKVFMENDPRYEVGTWDEAESIKIFYNTFISTKLALVNMIQDVAEKSGNINVDVVTNALAKSDYRITGPAYMKAGMGDAGACHPRDNIALRHLAEKLDLGYDLFDAIMQAREAQAEQLAKTCLKYGNDICIIGKAYKSGVPYINGSYSLLVGHYIEKHGGNVKYYDLNTGDFQFSVDSYPVYLIGYWEAWVEKLFEKNNVNHRGLVIDPWRILTKELYPGTIVHYGNTRIDKKKIKREQELLNLYTSNLWPEVKDKENIYIFNAAPTLIHTHDNLLVNEINEALLNGKDTVIFYNPSEPIADGEFEKIHKILPNLNINPNKIYYLTATYNPNDIYDTFCKKLGISEKMNIVSLAAMQHHTHMIASRIVIPEYTPRIRPKTFLCFNKVIRLHRLLLIGKLIHSNLIESGYCSTYYSERMMKQINEALPKLENIDNDAKLSIESSMDKFPLVIDEYKENRSNPIDILQDDLQYFENSYYSLVTETIYFKERIDPIDQESPYCHALTFTEKTFRPIALRHPFIIVGIYGFLKGLKELGYKTFAPYINEEYDNETNDVKRMAMIIDEVKRLNSFTDEQWLNWQEKIKPIVDHNYQLFFNTSDFKVSKNINI